MENKEYKRKLVKHIHAQQFHDRLVRSLYIYTLFLPPLHPQQTEILKLVFLIYFRILKHSRHSPLLQPVLEGLAKLVKEITKCIAVV